MQRYSPKHGFSEYEIDSLGNLVLFTDAQAKSLADERRIQELHTECEELFKELSAERTRRLAIEAALLRCKRVLESANRATPADFKIAAKDAADVLGTQYPRVEKET